MSERYIMDSKFAELVEHLAPKCAALLNMPPLSNGGLPVSMPREGVYLFTENSVHMYVGRSNSLRSRYGRHCRPGATHRMAAFAFQLAREKTNYLKATYKSEGSRDWLMTQPEFMEQFTAAKARIRSMDYRYVEEAHQTRQALLEIYVATVVGAKYNDFRTH